MQCHGINVEKGVHTSDEPCTPHGCNEALEALHITVPVVGGLDLVVHNRYRESQRKHDGGLQNKCRFFSPIFGSQENPPILPTLFPNNATFSPISVLPSNGKKIPNENSFLSCYDIGSLFASSHIFVKC